MNRFKHSSRIRPFHHLLLFFFPFFLFFLIALVPLLRRVPTTQRCRQRPLLHFRLPP